MKPLTKINPKPSPKLITEADSACSLGTTRLFLVRLKKNSRITENGRLYGHKAGQLKKATLRLDNFIYWIDNSCYLRSEITFIRELVNPLLLNPINPVTKDKN